jgi:signal transduction histidine kinase
MRGWSSASIRVRLTAWYAAVLFLMLAIYATASFLAVRHEFYEQLEDHPPAAGSDAYSEQHVEEQLREVRLVLVLGLPLVVGLAAVGGFMLAGRALAPMEVSFHQLRRFTADASHELRTPLSIIRGIGEVGLRETRTPAEYKEAIGSMLEEVDRLTKLVDTLLRLSHADAGTVVLSSERLDLGQVARDVAQSLGLLAEERAQRVTLDVASAVPVEADRLVLREAVANIVDNAVKYSPPGSTIGIDVRTEGSQALLTVTDQGPGVPVEYRERIFDRFFRIDEGRSRDHGGTGLGLAIAKWAVEANRGRLVVDAGPRGGSAFRIVLPLKGEQV